MSETTHLICARCGGDNAVSNGGQSPLQDTVLTWRCPGLLSISLHCKHCEAIYPIIPANLETTWQQDAYCQLGRRRDSMTPEAVRAVQDFLEPLS